MYHSLSRSIKAVSSFSSAESLSQRLKRLTCSDVSHPQTTKEVSRKQPESQIVTRPESWVTSVILPLRFMVKPIIFFRYRRHLRCVSGDNCSQ